MVQRKQFSQAALLSTGAALLHYEGILDPANGCALNAKGQFRGSAQLISPDRLSTADHNVINKPQEIKFGLSFDGGPEGGGDWVADPDGTTFSENPLLANRLWQLGLENWATSFTSTGDVSEHFATRNSLRLWFAEVDTEGFNDAGNKITFQPFAGNGSPMDASILKVTALQAPFLWNAQYDGIPNVDPYNAKEYVLSGEFDIDKPGIFFNQIKAKAFDSSLAVNGGGSIIDLEDRSEQRTALQLLSSSTWFGSTEPWETTPLACVSGVTDLNLGGLNSAGTACVSSSVCATQDASPTIRAYSNCISTTLGVVGGTSGGSMMAAPIYDNGAGTQQFRSDTARHAYGLAQGFRLEQSNLPKLHGWRDPQDAVPVQSGGLPTVFNHSIMSLGDGHFEAWGTRSKSYGPFLGPLNNFRPSPKEPETDGDILCTNQDVANGQAQCLFSRSVANNIWGTPPVNAAAVDYPTGPGTGDGSGSGPGGSGAPGGAKGGGGPKNWGSATIRILCDYNQYYGQELQGYRRTQAGLMVGVLGTANAPRVEQGNSWVASLGPVCAPWSSASWSDNWYWLIQFLRRNYSEENASENASWIPELRIALPFLTEWRAQTADLTSKSIRPMSMKTCPPNYVVKGVGVFHENTLLVGLQKLICVNKHGSVRSVYLAPETLAANDPQVNDAGQFEYQIHGQSFPLAQHIGNPYPGAGDSEEIVCPPGEGVAGLHVTGHQQTRIEQLWLECSKLPAPFPSNI